MILSAGSPSALSFTDDTSLPNASAKVSIHAQVIRELPLDWFYTLLHRAPVRTGELKSNTVVQVFFALAAFERRAIFRTLKTVRIHITDPRPYSRDVDELLCDVVPGGDVLGFLRRLDKARRQLAERERSRLIARRMLRDAPPHQIKVRHLCWEYMSGLRMRVTREEPFIDEDLMPYFEAEPPKDFDFMPFERSRKDMVNVLSSYLSKSESVFCEALDNLDDAIERGMQSPFVVSHSLSRILSASHAFDKGDTQEVSWIDGERRDVINRLDRRGLLPVQPAVLPELDSKESFFLQAADFAAGIAREIWSRNTLAHLVGAFDYVTYNGRRIYEAATAVI